jgi:glycine oxidase
VNDGAVLGVETALGFIRSTSVVIAAGAWASSIDPSLRIEIEPVRGQMLCFRTEPKVLRHVIYSSGGYLIPRRDGRLLAGSTSEHVGFDKRVTEDGSRAISSMAAQIAPIVTSLRPVDTWAGLRPRAADDFPLIGNSSEIDGLYYAAGHYRNGILLAPITGELLADAILSRTTSPLLSAFAPGRANLISTARQSFDTTEHVA